MDSPIVILSMPYCGAAFGAQLLEACGVSFGTSFQRDSLRKIENECLESAGVSLLGLDCRMEQEKLKLHFKLMEYKSILEQIRNQNKHWGLFGGRLHLFLPQILELYPNTRLIYLVREPGVTELAIKKNIENLEINISANVIQHSLNEYMRQAYNAKSDVKYTRIIQFDKLLKWENLIPQMFLQVEQQEDYDGLAASPEAVNRCSEIVLRRKVYFCESYMKQCPTTLPTLQKLYYTLQQKSI